MARLLRSIGSKLLPSNSDEAVQELSSLPGSFRLDIIVRRIDDAPVYHSTLIFSRLDVEPVEALYLDGFALQIVLIPLCTGTTWSSSTRSVYWRSQPNSERCR